MKKYAGFTLVEIMIVISIIGILAAVLYPSFSGYFERARDTAKRADLRLLESAFIQKDIDTGTYIIQWTWWRWWGQGWVNLDDDRRDHYEKSIIEWLQELGYLKLNSLKIYTEHMHSFSNSANAPCQKGHTFSNGYLFYTFEGRYSLSAYLERPKPEDVEHIQTLLYGGIEVDGICKRYGRNYGIGN